MYILNSAFTAITSPSRTHTPPAGDQFFPKECQARRDVELKVGAQVTHAFLHNRPFVHAQAYPAQEGLIAGLPGTQVMCVKNLPHDEEHPPPFPIVNGSRGVVVRRAHWRHAAGARARARARALALVRERAAYLHIPGCGLRPKPAAPTRRLAGDAAVASRPPAASPPQHLTHTPAIACCAFARSCLQMFCQMYRRYRTALSQLTLIT